METTIQCHVCKEDILVNPSNEEQTCACVKQLEVRKYDVSDAEAIMLQEAFVPFFKQASKWREVAEGIEVSGVDDKESMKAARETRLMLKEVRCKVENKRKELKEESLRKGKAIDGLANVVKFLIVPIEEELQKKEDFAEEQEKTKLALLVDTRRAQLHEFGVDTQFYDLGAMPEDTYTELLESSKVANENRIAAERNAKAKREQEQKEKWEEDERIRKENIVLKAKEDERKKVEEGERLKKVAEEKVKRDAELAPDKEKLVAFASAIGAMEPPKLQSIQAQAVLKAAIGLLAKTMEFILTKASSL